MLISLIDLMRLTLTAPERFMSELPNVFQTENNKQLFALQLAAHFKSSITTFQSSGSCEIFQLEVSSHDISFTLLVLGDAVIDPDTVASKFGEFKFKDAKGVELAVLLPGERAPMHLLSSTSLSSYDCFVLSLQYFSCFCNECSNDGGGRCDLIFLNFRWSVAQSIYSSNQMRT